VGATTLQYTATAGHLTALFPGASRQPEASFFYVAYTLDGQAPSTRPITFFYNGGPGSASVWLHLGSFGPRRIATGAPDLSGPQPFPLVDNAETLLDVTDMVFVDAIGTGYSEAIAPQTNGAFWGVDNDAAVFRDFVMRYLDVNSRNTSPKYLYGESYGGPRSAILASLLESAGVQLAGVVLQSPAMNYLSNCDIRENSTNCYGFLPSYAAAGAWAGLATPSPGPAQLPDYMVQMRSYAKTTYLPAAATFLSTALAPDALLGPLQGFTGLQASLWRARFNMGPTIFRNNLKPGTQYGRYDARVTGPPAASDNDPSSSLITPSFTTRIGEYLVNELRYTTQTGYVMSADSVGVWDFRHGNLPVPDSIPDLGAALAMNPGLKVLVLTGYHDVATPFLTTEDDMARLSSANITVRNYIGGHMTYLTDDSRVRQKADLAAWYRGTR